MFPINVSNYITALRRIAADAAAEAKRADEARLAYLERYAKPRAPGESRADYETRVGLAKATAPAGGWANARLASDVRGRIDVCTTLMGGCFVGNNGARARAAQELSQVLRLDGGDLPQQAAVEVAAWAAQVLTTPAAQRQRDKARRRQDEPEPLTAIAIPRPAAPLPPKPKVNPKATKAAAPAAKVSAVAHWLRQAWS